MNTTGTNLHIETGLKLFLRDSILNIMSRISRIEMGLKLFYRESTCNTVLYLNAELSMISSQGAIK